MGAENKARALLVEDEAGISELLKARLEAEGIEVLAAASAEEAEAALKASRPDLILLDYSLPGKDGRQFLSGLGELAAGFGPAGLPPVVITTGRGDERLAVELMKLGASDYLVKDGEFLQRIVPVSLRVLQEGRLKKELQEQQNRFKEIFELANVAKSITLADGTMNPNPAFCELLGYTREELSSKNWRDITIPEDVALTEEVGARLASGEIDKARFEKRYHRKDGGVVWGDISIKVKRSPAGGVEYFITSVVDITARKQAEAALRETRSLAQGLIENSSDLAWAVEPQNFGIIAVNEAAKKHFLEDKGREIRKGMRPDDAAPNDGRASWWRDAYAKALRENGCTLEYDLAAGGRTFLCGFTVLRDEKGPWAVSVLAKDITGIKKVNAELAAAAAENRLLAETIKASLNEIYIFDEESLRFKFVNSSALANLGYTEGEITALTPLDLKPDFTKEYFDGVLASLRSGGKKSVTFATRHRRKDGTLYPVEVHLQRMAENRVFLAVISDITERQKIEAELKQQADLLRLAGRAASFGGWRVARGGDRAIWTDETAALHEMPPGYSPSVEDAINFYTPECRPVIAAAVQACLEEGKPFDLELKIVTAKGRIRWVRAIGQAERDGGGAITSISGSFQDIDERKRLDIKLSEALAEATRFREAMDRVPVYVFIKDLKGRYVYANALTLKLFGCSAAELEGKDDGSFFPPETAALIREKDARVFAGAQSTAEIPVRRPDGSESLYFESKTPLYSDRERTTISGLLGVSTDVTELRRTKEALRESEAFNKMVLDNLPIGISVNSVKPGVNFSYMNDKFPALYGTTRERLAAPDAFWEAVYEDPEFRARIRGRVLADVASGDPARMRWEDVPIKRGERTRYVSAQDTPLPGSDLVISTVWDVTDRNEAMQAAQQRAQEALEAQRRARLGTFKLDLATGKFQVSEVIHEIYGIDAAYPHDLDGWRGLVHPDDREAVAAELDRLLAGATQEYRAESRIVRPSDGAVVWVNTRAHLEKAPGGREAAVIGTVLDITERKEAEKERERLAAAMDQTGEAVVITDSAGAIQYVNPAFERVTGYSRAEVLGRNPSILKSGRQDAGFYTDMWDKLMGGRQWIGRLVNKRKDGGLFIEEAVISPVKDSHGRIANYVAVKRDVTERLALEERLIQSQKMESIGLLAGGVAHDFNNLLTGITGYAGMLKKALPAGDPKLSDLQEILYAAERASELTRQLLIFSRKEVARPVAMDINEGVRSSQRLISRLIGEDVRLETELAAVPCVTRMDPGHFAQVLMNLAVNARDAMPKGGALTVSTRSSVKPDDRGEPMHVLEVADTGCGMTPEVRARIFEPFFTTKDRGKGTGLGLPMIYGIVEQAGGHITVSSEPGAGTRFSVYLPAAKLAPAEQAGPAKESAPEGGRGETILFVEDEERLRVLGQRMLEAGGYKVMSAAGGGEALEKAMALGRPVDIVVSDLVLPGMNGRELAQELSRRGLASRFLYVSGYTDELISRHGVLEEGVAFLSKPFTPLTLTGKVREVLDGPPEKARP